MAATQVTIRPESGSDGASIHLLTKEAFRHAEHSSFTEQFITDVLRESGMLTISLVAIDHNEVIGHVAISPVALSDGSSGWYGLGPVAVLPQRQGQGIGSLLITRALQDLRHKGAQGCVVLGEPRYYRRFGFRAKASLTLSGVPPQYFQALSFVERLPTAQVRYHASFDVTNPAR
jgi:putative acetyltransferase